MEEAQAAELGEAVRLGPFDEYFESIDMRAFFQGARKNPRQAPGVPARVFTPPIGKMLHALRMRPPMAALLAKALGNTGCTAGAAEAAGPMLPLDLLRNE